MSSDHNQTKPMTPAKEERSVNVPLMCQSNSLLLDDAHSKLMVSVNTILKPEVENSKQKLFSKLNNLLTKLTKHKYGWVFSHSVDGIELCLGMDDYLTIVKEPMDLGRVKAKLGKGLYKSPLDFAKDVRLTFNNAMLYCPEGQDVHIMAKNLLSLFEEEWVSIEEQFDHLLGKVKSPPTPSVLGDSTDSDSSSGHGSDTDN